MKLSKKEGITIIALMITIIIMLILLGVGIHFGTEAIARARLEDIKTDMISIKTKAKIIAEQYNFKDVDSLTGTPLDSDIEQLGIQESYIIPQELKTIFESVNEDETSKFDISKLYVWSQENLDNQSLDTIKVGDNKFYIVYYNLEGTNLCEVYYSEGYKGKYSLTDLKDM